MARRLLEDIIKQGRVGIPREHWDPKGETGLRVNRLAEYFWAELELRQTDDHPFPVINIKNVADYALARAREDGMDRLDKLPSIRAPWPKFWMEGPICITVTEATEPHEVVEKYPTMFGMFFNAFDLDGHAPDEVQADARERYGASCHMVMDCQIYLRTPEAIGGPLCVWQVALDEAGYVLDEFYTTTTTLESEMSFERFRDSMREILLMGAWALAFLNCTNGELETPTIPAKVERKRRAKLGGKPPIRYSMIKVRGMGRGGGGGEHGAGEDRGEHIVRGHFSHYGNCCPGNHEPRGKLFGKLEGRYWMPQHLRGDRALGVVQSDYEIDMTEPSDAGG